jgi:hypothetical protein
MPSSSTPFGSQAAATQLISHFFISISFSGWLVLVMLSKNACSLLWPSHARDSIQSLTGLYSTASSFEIISDFSAQESASEYIDLRPRSMLIHPACLAINFVSGMSISMRFLMTL